MNASGALKARVHARLLAHGSGGRAPARRRRHRRDRRRAAGGCRNGSPTWSPSRGPSSRRPSSPACRPKCWPRSSGLGPLQPLLADPDVTEVMVNGPGRVWVERGGRLERVPMALDAAADRAPHREGRRAARPAHRPLVAPRRRPPARRLPRQRGRAAARRRRAVPHHPPVRRPGGAARPTSRRRPVVALLRLGGRRPAATCSSRAAPAPARPRCSTPSPAASPPASGSSPSRTPPSCACPATTWCGSRPGPPTPRAPARCAIRDLVRNALRMRPDRIVVGEVRGAEALDMLQAMNTGHEGSLSTCHANSPDDALRRLETMVLMGDVGLPLAAVRAQVEASLDLVVQVARRPDGSPAGRGGGRGGRPPRSMGRRRHRAGAGARTRLVADESAVVALPRRAGRSAGHPDADPAWMAA